MARPDELDAVPATLAELPDEPVRLRPVNRTIARATADEGFLAIVVMGLLLLGFSIYLALPLGGSDLAGALPGAALGAGLLAVAGVLRDLARRAGLWIGRRALEVRRPFRCTVQIPWEAMATAVEPHRGLHRRSIAWEEVGTRYKTHQLAVRLVLADQRDGSRGASVLFQGPLWGYEGEAMTERLEGLAMALERLSDEARR